MLINADKAPLDGIALRELALFCYHYGVIVTVDFTWETNDFLLTFRNKDTLEMCTCRIPMRDSVPYGSYTYYHYVAIDALYRIGVTVEEKTVNEDEKKMVKEYFDQLVTDGKRVPTGPTSMRGEP